ncbi:hypothetical protein [Heyndrickxia acidicola]|uniref:hypothetical protein n=1 Tax=Heyndrickxia acidicola TaxID=209389 RepID=UPI000B296C03|nr:hypothetical protein [Heyndrickxia acidicola]
MDLKEYRPKSEKRPDGIYGVIRHRITNEKLFEQKCDNHEIALNVSEEEYRRLLNN